MGAHKDAGQEINKEINDNQKEIELLIYKRLRALIWKDKTGAIAKAKEVEDHVLRHKMSQLRQRDFVWSRLDTLSCYFHFCKLVKEVFEERVIGNSKISKTKLFADWNKHDDMLVQNLKYAGMIENRLGSDNPEEVAEDYKQGINESCPIRMEKIKTSFGEEFNPESESFGKAGGGLLSIEWEKVEEDLEEILIHDGCSSESEDSESSDEEDYETSWSDWLPSFRAVWLSFCLLVAAGVFTTVFWDSVVPDAGFDMV